MAELDSLEIRITASTDKANKSIDALIGTLGELNKAFDIKGVDGFVGAMQNLSAALDSINSDNLKAVSNALGGLSKSAKSLATLGNGANQAGSAIAKLSKEIAGDFNITDKGAIAQLTKHITDLYHASDRTQLSGSIAAIQDLITQYSSFEREMSGVNAEVLEFLKNTKIHLDSTWAKELGDDHKWIRATIGLLNTVREGGLEASEALAQMKAMGAGVEFTPNNDDALRIIAEYIRETKEAQETTLTFSQAVREGVINYNALDSALEKIAHAVGLTTEQLGNMAINAPDERITAGFQQMGNVLEHLETIGNPFENVVYGLQQLGEVQLSNSLQNLYIIRDAMGKIGGKSGQAAGESLSRIAAGMNELSNANVPEFGAEIFLLSKQMRALGSKSIVNAANSLGSIANGLNALKAVGTIPQISGLEELATSLSVFGRKTAKEAVTTIPALATAFRGLIDTLSSAPLVSQNVIDLANAMASLIQNAKGVHPATRKAGNGLSLFTQRAKKATRASFNLASAIGKVYATYWTLFRVMGMFKKSIDLASDLTEVQNVVDHVFGSMAESMDNFAKTAVETTGMSELTAKKIGSRFQSMAKNMGISQNAMRQAGDFVAKTTNNYAEATDKVADMSIALTKLTGDMASFYNLDYEDVAEDMEAIYTGMTRPLRKYGLDLTQATLKEFALANGLNADIKNMTQAEKTLLRYQYVMSHTTAAQGDFERTMGTWANQTRIAQENLKKLQIILGQIGIYSFKPLVRSFNLAMNDILHLAESTFNSLGTIFGWQVDISAAGVVDDLADSLEDAADGYDDAAAEGKKFKNFLLGIDELNLLPDNSDKDKGDGDGAIAAMATGLEDSVASFRKTEGMFDSIYDTLFKLGKRIGEVQKDWLKSIDWDSIFGKAEAFGKGLASFLNGYLSDAELFYHKGRFIANGINTIAHAIYAFFHEFDGYQLGKDIGFEINGITHNLDWTQIKSAAYEMAHDVTEFFNGVFENTNWYDVGRTIIEGINTAVLFVSTFWNEIHWDVIGRALGDGFNGLIENWDAEEMARLFHGKIQAIFDLANNFLDQADFVELGQKIGTFLSEMHLEDFADDLAMLLWNVLKAAFEILPTMAAEAPVETALIAAFCGFKYTGFGNNLGGILGGAITGGLKNAGLSGSLGGVLAMDLDAIVTSGSLLVQATAIGEAIAGGIVAAWAGYNFGLKLHDIIFEDDAMWSEKGAVVEALENIQYWGDAVGQMVTDLKTNVADYDKALDSFYGINADFAQKDFGITSGQTWEDVKNSVAKGSMQFSEAQFEQMKEMLLNSGNSNIDVNNLINSLKDARDDYLNGFKPWLEDQKDIQYALQNGTQFSSQILDEAYDKYLSVMEVQAEIERKTEALANSPISRYNAAKQIEENVAAMNEEITAWNGLSSAQQNWLRQTDQVPDRILNLQKMDFGGATAKAVGKLGKSMGEFGKKAASALSESINSMAIFKLNFENLGFSVGSQSEQIYGALNSIDKTGSGLFTGQAQSMENLYTKMLLTKDGLEKVSSAFDVMDSKKDKTNNLKDSFDGIKGKVEEIGTLFSFDRMSDIFSSIPDAFLYAWKDALNVMKIMWTELANWINANAKIEIPKTKVGNQEIGGKMVQLKVPRFDIGGSIPNNGSLFVANERGAEVVANMGSRTGVMNTDQMEAAVANGMMKALAAGGQNVTVVLEGDASNFFTAMVRENNNAIMRVGASPLRV